MPTPPFLQITIHHTLSEEFRIFSKLVILIQPRQQFLARVIDMIAFYIFDLGK